MYYPLCLDLKQNQSDINRLVGENVHRVTFWTSFFVEFLQKLISAVERNKSTVNSGHESREITVSNVWYQ